MKKGTFLIIAIVTLSFVIMGKITFKGIEYVREKNGTPI